MRAEIDGIRYAFVRIVQTPIASRASTLAEELHLLSRFAEMLVKQGGGFNRCRHLHTDARPNHSRTYSECGGRTAACS